METSRISLVDVDRPLGLYCRLGWCASLRDISAGDIDFHLINELIIIIVVVIIIIIIIIATTSVIVIATSNRCNTV